MFSSALVENTTLSCGTTINKTQVVDTAFHHSSLASRDVDHIVQAVSNLHSFEVWLIPETLRMTTFADKPVGAALNIEIERGTQVFVDTVRDAIEERLGPLLPALEALLRQQGQSLDDLSRPAALPRA